MELDALKINKSTNQILNPISAKLVTGKSYEEKLPDWRKLEIFRTFPISAAEAKNYLLTFNETPFKQFTNAGQVESIAAVKVKYIQLSDGKEVVISLMEFKQKLKLTQYTSSDLIEVSPVTFGISRDDILESLYYRIISKEIK